MITVPRELVQFTLIKSVKRRAIQQNQNRRDILINQGNNRSEINHKTLQHGRNTLLSSLEEETAKIVALE